MIWDLHLEVIAMLTSVVEGGRPKCEVYWPMETYATLDLENFSIRCVSIEDRHETITISTMEVTRVATKERRTVYHVHYTGWPDHGVPASPIDFLDVLSCIAALRSKVPNCGPTLVHCSAGIGRTGVLVVVTVALDLVSLCIEITFDLVG
jgi:protein tyrosine phosphatase